MRHVLIAAALGLAACSGPAPLETFVQDARAGRVDAKALGLESFDSYSIGGKDVINGSYQTDAGSTIMLSYTTEGGVTLIESWEDAQNAYTDTDLDCKIDEAALANTESFNPKLVTFGDQGSASKTEQATGQIKFNTMIAGFGVQCSA